MPKWWTIGNINEDKLKFFQCNFITKHLLQWFWHWFLSDIWYTHRKGGGELTLELETKNWKGNDVNDYLVGHGPILARRHREAHSRSLEHLGGTNGCNPGTCRGSSGSLMVDKSMDAHLFCKLSSWWCWDKILVFSFLILLIPGCSSSMDMVLSWSHLI